MSDQTQNPEAAEAEPTAAPEQTQTQQTEAQAAADAAPKAEADPAQEIAELKDKLLRAIAETENVRRIAAREKADAAKYAVANFARDMLSVADYMGMAMQSVAAEARETDANLNNLCVGVEMTQRELLNVFERAGIKPVAAEGQPFDHNIHEAVSQQENPDVPANTVVMALRGGFTIHDRLLRPAQVIVSTGGPKAENGADAAQAGGDGSASKGQKAYETKAGAAHAVDQET